MEEYLSPEVRGEWDNINPLILAGEQIITPPSSDEADRWLGHISTPAIVENSEDQTSQEGEPYGTD